MIRALLRKMCAQNQSRIQICVHGTAHKLNTYSKRESLSWSRRLLLAKRNALQFVRTNLWWFLACRNGGIFCKRLHKMKEETKFITTNTHFSHTPFAAEKSYRCEYYCRQAALRTIPRSHSAQTRDLAIRGTGQPAKGEQVFSGLTRDRG